MRFYTALLTWFWMLKYISNRLINGSALVCFWSRAATHVREFAKWRNLFLCPTCVCCQPVFRVLRQNNLQLTAHKAQGWQTDASRCLWLDHRATLHPLHQQQSNVCSCFGLHYTHYNRSYACYTSSQHLLPFSHVQCSVSGLTLSVPEAPTID